MTIRIISLSCVLALFSSYMTSAQEPLDVPLFSKNICTEYCKTMTPQEQQIFANVVYFLYANALLDAKMCEYYTPLARLTQLIRANMIDPTNTNDELAILYHLIENLSYVTKARLIYTAILDSCFDHYNQHKTDAIDKALEALQINAQQCLQEWAQEHGDNFIESLKISTDILSEGAQNILVASNMYKGLSKGALPFEVAEENKLLAAIHVVTKSNPTFTLHAENIANALDGTMDEAMKIVYIGVEVYKQYYEEIYAIMASHDQDYAAILFDDHGLLPEEYRSPLPHASAVIEEIYRTTKGYCI